MEPLLAPAHICLETRFPLPLATEWLTISHDGKLRGSCPFFVLSSVSASAHGSFSSWWQHGGSRLLGPRVYQERANVFPTPRDRFLLSPTGPLEDTHQPPIHVKCQGVPVLMDLTERDIVKVESRPQRFPLLLCPPLTEPLQLSVCSLQKKNWLLLRAGEKDKSSGSQATGAHTTCSFSSSEMGSSGAIDQSPSPRPWASAHLAPTQL